MDVRENLQQKVDSCMKDFHETQQKKQLSTDEEDQLPLNLDPESSSEKAPTSGETPITTDDMNSQLLTAANLFETSVLMSGCRPKVPTSSSNHDAVKGTPKRKQNFSPDETVLDKKKCTPAGTPSTSPTATPVKRNISARDSNIKSETFPSEDEKI